ncbi:UDP-glycosyltransferase [Flavobacterium sp. FZUC8N2.13]|uniref:UDP-glycosyltransferase n=1 Tax=Flavobacterium zubiriense TaxID=3138075 RepID=A0ABV4T986_9FLAO
MKILIVVDSINEDDNSGAKANVALIQNLWKSGFDVLVYHYSRKEIHLEGIKCESIKEIKLSAAYFLSRSQRKISKFFKININPIVERLIGFSFTFFNDVNSIKKALKKNTNFQPDWVLTLSYGSSFRPHRALLALPRLHNKWLAYVHDPYPMHCYPRPYDWVEPGYQFKRDFFLKIVNKSQYLLYPSQLLDDWMKSYYHGQKNDSIIIPHQIFEKNIKKEDITLLPDFINPDFFNVLHAGSMMEARNPKTLIEAYEVFLHQNPEAKNHSKLLFIGKKSCFDVFIKEKQLTIPQIYISEEYLPFQNVKVMQKVVMVNVILEAGGPISPFLPGKFPHCIYAKRPILLLGPNYSESKRLLGENYPYWSELNNLEKIAEQITSLYNSWLVNKNIIMDRNDLMQYLSSDYLREIFIKLKA